MTLTVEDGTGLSTADSLITLAYADAYHLLRGNTAWTGTDALKEAAIIRASFFLSNSYRWAGTLLQGRSQALAWPRVNVADREGWVVPSNAVPVEVQQAVAEVALRELVTPGTMTPDFTTSGVKRERVKAGPVESETEYQAGYGPESARPVLLIVRDLIGGLLAVGADAGAMFGRAVRG